MDTLKAHRFNPLLGGADTVNSVTLCGRVIATKRLMASIGDECAVCEASAAAKAAERNKRSAAAYMREWRKRNPNA